LLRVSLVAAYFVLTLAGPSLTLLPSSLLPSLPDVGSGATIFVLDTGVRTTHKQFAGRASFGFNAAGGKINTDKDGHGTFVAGVAASTDYGVCKLCNVISVKVFTDGGDCSASILIKAFNWVAAQKSSGAVNGTIVINISVGGDPGETSDVMDAAVNALVGAGVHVVGAAGNENTDACTESPSRAKRILAVGSSMLLAGTMDYFLGGSNFGTCVKLFAPGDKIVSLGISSDTAVGVTDSGTSFSSPHVAGALARLQAAHPTLGLDAVQGMLLNSTLKGVIGGVPKGTLNRLLHQGCVL
jgi:subtilisin family serine protease|tara:strand:- start:329 stop:1222 length:894 start_codon:yes stop_codon:yes gene_type:complete